MENKTNQPYSSPSSFEESSTDLYNDDIEIPTVDFSTLQTNKDDFIQKLGDSLVRFGFVILVNHGINVDLLEATEKKAKEFFESVPQQEKEKFLIPRQHTNKLVVGYVPRLIPNILQKFIIPLEGWKFHQNAFDFENPEFKESEFWPDTTYEACASVFREYYLSQKELATPLISCLLQYLKLDPQLFPKTSVNTLRFNYYFPLQPEEFLNNTCRMYPHADMGIINMMAAPSSSGLQVLNQEDMKWIRVNAPKNSLIFNIGRVLQRMTNDIFPAAIHRVIKPSPSQNAVRVTFPFNSNLKEDEILEVLPGLGEPKYQPLRVFEFFNELAKEAYGDNYASRK